MNEKTKIVKKPKKNKRKKKTLKLERDKFVSRTSNPDLEEVNEKEGERRPVENNIYMNVNLGSGEKASNIHLRVSKNTKTGQENPVVRGLPKKRKTDSKLKSTARDRTRSKTKKKATKSALKDKKKKFAS